MTAHGLATQGWCSYCSEFADTRDHILPQAWGRVDFDIPDTRPACQRCNQFRGVCGHCPAAMAALRAVIGPVETVSRRDEIALAQLWGWCGERAQARAAIRRGYGADLDQIRAVWAPYPVPAQDIRPQQGNG
jgi:hypothetical protein